MLGGKTAHWTSLNMLLFANVLLFLLPFLCRVDGDCLSHENHAVEYILLLNIFQVSSIFTCQRHIFILYRLKISVVLKSVLRAL